ncbi:MAG TPA: hypothetical protein DEF21_22045, partial [Thalassospira lucentensis]|nr:hypothetical protein [Thalassospira lucentensis]
RLASYPLQRPVDKFVDYLFIRQINQTRRESLISLVYQVFEFYQAVPSRGLTAEWGLWMNRKRFKF